MNNKKYIKHILLMIIVLVILFSLAKTLGLQEDNNLLEQKSNELSQVKNEGTNDDSIKNANTKTDNTDIEDDISVEISQQHEGLPVLSQDDEIKTDYFTYVFKDVSLSKELGDFNKDDGFYGHIDEEGNTIGPYSYLILNVEFKSRKDSQTLYLNTLKPYLYKGAELLRGYEAFTSNNPVPVNIRGALKCVMEEGEVREFNIVYLVDDEYLKDSDLYVYINNYGVSYGQDLDNKKLVKLDWKGVEE